MRGGLLCLADHDGDLLDGDGPVLGDRDLQDSKLQGHLDAIRVDALGKRNRARERPHRSFTVQAALVPGTVGFSVPVDGEPTPLSDDLQVPSLTPGRSILTMNAAPRS